MIASMYGLVFDTADGATTVAGATTCLFLTLCTVDGATTVMRCGCLIMGCSCLITHTLAWVLVYWFPEWLSEMLWLFEHEDVLKSWLLPLAGLAYEHIHSRTQPAGQFPLAVRDASVRWLLPLAGCAFAHTHSLIPRIPLAGEMF